MGHEPIKKNTKQKWVIIGVIFLTVGCIIGLAIKRKPVQNAEGSMSAEDSMSAEENMSAEDSMSAEDNLSKQTELSVEISIEREKEFIEFEKLFREQEDDLKKLAEELVNQNLLENQNYIIFFDEQSYDKDFLKLFYIDGTFKSGAKEELVEELKSIDFFTDFTDEEIDKILSFNDAFKLDVNEELVVANAFQYCEDEGLENIYCHKKVEDNWYLWIKPVPDY